MNGAPVAAAEGPRPMYTEAPPTQQPADLPGALAIVESIIFRDGGMDQQESMIFQSWLQNFMLKAQAVAQQNAQMGAGPDQQGLGATSAPTSDYSPWGGGDTSEDAPEFATL